MVSSFSVEKSAEATQAIKRLNETFLENEKAMPEILNLIGTAKGHAESLYEYSLSLENMLTDTRNTNAVKAVSAYRDIENAINIARASATEAIETATKISFQVAFLRIVQLNPLRK